jgi:hypothetical protein
VLFVSFIAGDLGLSVVPVAILSLLLFILGIAVFPQRATTFILQWPAIASDENLVATIDNTQYPILGYEQELILSVKIRNGLKLLATVVLSAVSLYFVTAGTLSLESELRRPFGALIATFALEFLLYGGAIVLLTNARWCDERRFLKGSHCAIADVISHDNGLRGGFVISSSTTTANVGADMGLFGATEQTQSFWLSTTPRIRTETPPTTHLFSTSAIWRA